MTIGSHARASHTASPAHAPQASPRAVPGECSMRSPAGRLRAASGAWREPASGTRPALAGEIRPRRILLARDEHAAADAVGLAAQLLEATGAARCIEAGALAPGDRRALSRLLSEADGVLVDALARGDGSAPAGRHRAGLPALLQVRVRLVSSFGSAVTRLQPLRPDVPFVAPIDEGAAAWERAAEVAFALADREGRDEVWCAARDAGWPLLASDRARRFRRAALSRVAVAGRRLSLADARRRLLFPDGSLPGVLLADAGELEGLVRVAAAGVGWASAIPTLYLGPGVALGEVASSESGHRIAANGQLALAAARLAGRLLHHLRAHGPARRLETAVAAELEALSRGRLDPWIELASEPAIRFVGALLDRLAAASPVEVRSA